MDKKLLFTYLAISVGLLILGPLTNAGIVNGYVGFFSLYLTIRFIYDGFKHDQQNKNFYVLIIVYLLGMVLFNSHILYEIAGAVQNNTMRLILQMILGGLLSALPYIWYLIQIESEQVTQKTRAWYFIISPVIILPLSLLLMYMTTTLL